MIVQTSRSLDVSPRFRRGRKTTALRHGPRGAPEAADALPPTATAPSPSTTDTSADRVGVLLYLYLAAMLLPIWFRVGPLYLSLLRLLLIVVIVPVLLKLLRGGYGRALPTDYLFIAHTLWAAVALAVNNPDQVIQQVGSVGMEFLGGYAVGRASIRSKADFLAMCRAMLITVLVLLPFTFHETLTGNPLIVRWIDALPGINSVVPVYIERRLGLERVQSVFAHPIHYGLYCSIALSLVFVGLRGTLSDTFRWLASLLVLLGGFLALSSGALLAMILQVFLIAWNAAFRSIKARWWLLIAMMAVGYISVELISTRSAIRVFMSYATFSAHNAYWRGIIFEWGLANVIGSIEKSIPGSPFFGIGMNNWIRPAFMHSGSMDNFWLVMGVRYGLPGFFFLAIGYCWALWRVIQCDLGDDPLLARIRLAWVFTFVGLTFTLCTVHVWTSIYSFTFFMLGAGLWLLDAGTKPSAKDTTSLTEIGAHNVVPAAELSMGLTGDQLTLRTAPPGHARFRRRSLGRSGGRRVPVGGGT